MSVEKEYLDLFKGRFKLEDLTRTAIHGYSKDISDAEEIMLKELIIAFNAALDNFGIEAVYLSPELIKVELSFYKAIRDHAELQNLNE